MPKAVSAFAQLWMPCAQATMSGHEKTISGNRSGGRSSSGTYDLSTRGVNQPGEITL